MKKIDQIDKADLFKGFINAMLVMGYAEWYIGEKIALLIWTLDNMGRK